MGRNSIRIRALQAAARLWVAWSAAGFALPWAASGCEKTTGPAPDQPPQPPPTVVPPEFGGRPEPTAEPTAGPQPTAPPTSTGLPGPYPTTYPSSSPPDDVLPPVAKYGGPPVPTVTGPPAPTPMYGGIAPLPPPIKNAPKYGVPRPRYGGVNVP